MFSRFPNLDFRYIKGGCLQIGSSWEIDIHKINIRNVWNLTSNLINFDENSSSIQYANITACNFDEIYVEAVTGDVINIESNCSFANNKIGLINFEPNSSSVIVFPSFLASLIISSISCSKLFILSPIIFFFTYQIL